MSKNRSEKTGSLNDEWETPASLFDVLNNEFGFNFDLACISSNCKVADGCMADKGGCGISWVPDSNKEYSVWCNPPYSIQLKPLFIKKCYD